MKMAVAKQPPSPPLTSRHLPLHPAESQAVVVASRQLVPAEDGAAEAAARVEHPRAGGKLRGRKGKVLRVLLRGALRVLSPDRFRRLQDLVHRRKSLAEPNCVTEPHVLGQPVVELSDLVAV